MSTGQDKWPRRCVNIPGPGRHLLRGPDVKKPTRAFGMDAWEYTSAQIVLAIETSTSISDQTRPRFIATFNRFVSFCRRGCDLGSLEEVGPEAARAFVFAPLEDRDPSVATMHLRRAVVRF